MFDQDMCLDLMSQRRDKALEEAKQEGRREVVDDLTMVFASSSNYQAQLEGCMKVLRKWETLCRT